MIICCGVAMASLPFDGLDDLLFDMYKKQVCIFFLFLLMQYIFYFLSFLLLWQVLKHLRTKMTLNMVRTLQRIKVSEQFIIFRKLDAFVDVFLSARLNVFCGISTCFLSCTHLKGLFWDICAFVLIDSLNLVTFVIFLWWCVVSFYGLFHVGLFWFFFFCGDVLFYFSFSFLFLFWL